MNLRHPRHLRLKNHTDNLSAGLHEPSRAIPMHTGRRERGKSERHAKRPENPENRPIWLLSSAFPPFQVSFWSLFGLFLVSFKAYPETKKRKPCDDCE